ncbi:homeobox protein meis3-B-like [Limulus polyphemus]|uniref:Homeobox protein meis3-B-like n=1 Tax=Limulus polyphemus TaxID=6850 RepID=A0ABM1TQI6_LIMPO|nr:homeobox protein meis3-B-like [Limulus polyphemus]
MVDYSNRAGGDINSPSSTYKSDGAEIGYVMNGSQQMHMRSSGMQNLSCAEPSSGHTVGSSVHAQSMLLPGYPHQVMLLPGHPHSMMMAHPGQQVVDFNAT